jgi:antirestriction protein ArdC
MFSKYTKDALTVLQNEIVDGLKKDGLKYFKSFSGYGYPKNALTLKEYSGINFWGLNIQKRALDFKSNLWATKKAWLGVGATILEGQEKSGRAIFYYSTFKKDVKKNEKIDEKTFAFLKVSYVYNLAQVDLKNSTYRAPSEMPESKVVDNKEIENFITSIEGLHLSHSNDGKCFYNITADKVVMSDKKTFKDTPDNSATGNYYSVLFHELIHWSGAKNRLARFEKNKKRFKDNAQLEYAHEELIAEIGAVLLSQRFNIQQTINNNNLAYLKSWISALQNDNKFLISALSQSYRASEFLLNKGKLKEYPEQLRKVA